MQSDTLVLSSAMLDTIPVPARAKRTGRCHRSELKRVLEHLLGAASIAEGEGRGSEADELILTALAVEEALRA